MRPEHNVTRFELLGLGDNHRNGESLLADRFDGKAASRELLLDAMQMKARSSFDFSGDLKCFSDQWGQVGNNRGRRNGIQYDDAIAHGAGDFDGGREYFSADGRKIDCGKDGVHNGGDAAQLARTQHSACVQAALRTTWQIMCTYCHSPREPIPPSRPENQPCRARKQACSESECDKSKTAGARRVRPPSPP
jgi:hypothetical protein